MGILWGNWHGNGILFFQKGENPGLGLVIYILPRLMIPTDPVTTIHQSVIFPLFLDGFQTNKNGSQAVVFHFTFQGTQQTPDQLKNVLVREASGQAAKAQ